MAEDEAFKALQSTVSSALIDVTRTAGQIAGEDLPFHRSLNPSIAPVLDHQSTNLLNLIQGLAKSFTSGTEVTVPNLTDADSVEDNWKGIVDVIDNLLEKADGCLDEYTGVIKKFGPSEENHAAAPIPFSRGQFRVKNYRDQDLPKPQLLFDNVPTNDETSPFKPLLRAKPHAIVSPAESLTLEMTEDGFMQYKHPYESEITGSKYPATVNVKSDPIPPLPFDSTEATLVDSPEAVNAMLEELKHAREIAVDLEHHSAHSFIGLVSLMQISTRDKDWIVDTLKPWREELQVLNEVFANPSIVKVFHGAFMDMVWLQRDLGLYVVGLFDTFHASRCLRYPRNSLAALLKHFVNFDADKQYQLADWRIRPLPKEMFNYARSDTHFLLYVYDHLRNELLEKSDLSREDGNLIEEVLQRSKAEALQRYERPIYDAQNGKGAAGWYNMLVRTPALFSKEQFAVFRAVHQWRQDIARKDDESEHEIMPKHVIFNIARQMPMDMQSLLSCSHPISATVRSRTGELLQIVKEAKIAGAIGPEMLELMRPLKAAPIEDRKRQNLPVETHPNAAVVSNNIPSSIQAPRSNLSVRTHVSQFWGLTLEESVLLRQKFEAQRKHQNLRLALPLPQLSAEVFQGKTAGGNFIGEANQHGPGARVEHQYVRERKPKESSVFVVNQVGDSRKRKADDLEDPPDEGRSEAPAEIALDDGDDDDGELEVPITGSEDDELAQHEAETLARKSEHRRSKRDRKRKRKRLERQRSTNGTKHREQSGEEEAFFDYANAPSVLHAKKDKNDRMGTKESFDPYTKSLNAPKGMRNNKKEVGGKSFTFKK